MIILAALLAMQGFSDSAVAAPKAKAPVAHAAAKSAPVKTAPDIAPLEKKLAGWKGRWGYNDAKFVCETTKTTGIRPWIRWGAARWSSASAPRANG
jgi:hypothetical protein